MKYEAGLFTENWEKTEQAFSDDATKQVARQAVGESMVLLKNDDVLPLRKGMKVYITGPASDSVGVQSGGWTLSWQGELNDDLNNGTSLKDAFDATLQGTGTLVDTPEEADVIVLALGEKPYAEMMGDTRDLSLSGPLSLQENMSAVESVKGFDKPVVTIIIAGRPLLINEHLSDWDALVMAWLPGTEGLGMTDVLFGDLPFTGKLPVTWPLTNEQASDSKIMEDYETIEHQFKFGFGLEY